MPKGWYEHAITKGLKSGWFGEVKKLYRQGNEYVVMYREVETDWGTVIHAWIRNRESTDIPWAEKQRIKNEIFGKESQAIEIFPKESKLIDAANMYHLWVLPEDMEIPFGIDR